MSRQQHEAGPKPKREISPARLAANKANAKKSCGPRSPEGKSVSKFNGLVHGIRAESDILPGDDPRELQRRIDVWADELGAETGPERGPGADRSQRHGPSRADRTQREGGRGADRSQRQVR